MTPGSAISPLCGLEPLNLCGEPCGTLFPILSPSSATHTSSPNSSESKCSAPGLRTVSTPSSDLILSFPIRRMEVGTAHAQLRWRIRDPWVMPSAPAFLSSSEEGGMAELCPHVPMDCSRPLPKERPGLPLRRPQPRALGTCLPPSIMDPTLWASWLEFLLTVPFPPPPFQMLLSAFSADTLLRRQEETLGDLQSGEASMRKEALARPLPSC